MTKQYGPDLQVSKDIHEVKYRSKGESFKDYASRVANVLSDSEEHFRHLQEMFGEQRALPAGRIQAAVGAVRQTTAFNCFVSGEIEDSMSSIMGLAGEAAETMRLGGGIGYDFSNLRPKGDHIKSLDSTSSGPLSFMKVYDAVCATISSAGHRRGAQMGVLRVDHPDIQEFVKAKTNDWNLTNFNVSVGITDEFMDAVKRDKPFDLRFDGRVYATVSATALWEDILRATWDWAEPGVLFIDRINAKNNLFYCEDIAATNPCGEQPLPPYGACLLGSLNLVKYLIRHEGGAFSFNTELFKRDITAFVRAIDNVIDNTVYPLPEQEQEAKNKRRMGIGVTGLANAVEAMGFEYGSTEFLLSTEYILMTLRDTAYRTSVALAIEKGPFPLFDPAYLNSDFAETLPDDIREDIRKYGIRNSHLLSIAPTGTISLSADNVSSGIEPVFSFDQQRIINMPDGTRSYSFSDYGREYLGVEGKVSSRLTVDDHVNVLILASKYVDSACSKTCTVGDNVTWQEFKDVYMKAYDGGASGCTTFRPAGKRFGIITEGVEDVEEVDMYGEGTACYIDPETGNKECS